jgi:hypothetical protein
MNCMCSPECSIWGKRDLIWGKRDLNHELHVLAGVFHVVENRAYLRQTKVSKETQSQTRPSGVKET